jgi:glucose-6-phosphate 1-dehydrogenase
MLIDPVLKRWDQLADPPLRTYDPGGWGPSEADDFMARDGRAWNMGCGEHLG